MNYDFLEHLLQTIGVAGFESKVAETYAGYVKAYVDSLEADMMNNVYARINGSGDDCPTVMIEAHADEIGFQVINISDSGYVYLRRCGGIDEQCVPGSQMVIQTAQGELINGVVGKKPIHLMSSDDRKKTLEIHQLWLDTGLSADELREKVSVGDPVVLRSNMVRLGEHRISSKALDNKVGVFILSEAMRLLGQTRPCDCNVVGVATSQEEVGSRGAVIAAYKINPDISITIDMDFATDVPDCNPNRYGRVMLGSGVVIPRNADSYIPLSRKAEEVARKHDIAYQLSARPHATGGTNTSRIQISRDGVKTLSLGIPCRYMHTPVELCDMRDVEAAINLIVKLIQSL